MTPMRNLSLCVSARVRLVSRFVGLVAAVFGLGADAPEILRVRVPAEQVPAWFPKGAQLRGMARDAFEDLARRAREGAARSRALIGPRLLRARHTARWKNGMLIGESELVVARSTTSAPLTLEPWTPAITAIEPDSALLGADTEGHLALKLAEGDEGRARVRWELRAREGAEGRVFALGLPRLDLSSLTLDLPEDLVPEGLPGVRRELPHPGPGRRCWRFDGTGGAMTLRLRAEGAREAAAEPSRIWVGGPTTIDVDEAAARWRADWEVDPGAEGPRWLTLQLDPGLEPVEVTGPGVLAFQTEPDAQGARLRVRLNAELPGPTLVTVWALARVPDEGPWTVPAARPLDAVWTGGRTIVRISPSRVVADCQPRAGRRVAPRPNDPADRPLLVFESSAPKAVADLIFRKPSGDATAEVRGRLVLGSETPRIEAAITWRVHHGRLLALVADCPAGWIPNRVQVEGLAEPVSWQVEQGPKGTSRVRVQPPTTLSAGDPITLTLLATAPDLGQSGPLELPRVRPVDVGIGDERWLAQVEPGWSVQPLEAKGLAWIDPALVSGGSTAPNAALAWRWTEPDAAARIDRGRQAAEPRGELRGLVIVEADRLRCDWLLVLDRAEGSPRSLRIESSAAIEPPPEWRLAGDEASPPLPLQPVDRKSWELALPRPCPRRVVLRAQFDQPWTGRGRVPLLALPPPYHRAGTLVVLVGRTTQSSAEVTGLCPLDPTLAWKNMLADREPLPDLARFRRAHAFSFDSPSGTLDLRTEALHPGPSGGAIEEAVLTTLVAPGNRGTLRHRLLLRVVPTRSESLDMTLPPGTTLERIRRDGQPTAATHQNHRVSLALPGPCTVLLDLTTPGGWPLRPPQPELSWPCLSFCWQVALPEPWRAEASDLVPLGSGLERDPPLPASHLPPPASPTLADWLVRADAGRSPLIIDRLALAAAGWGPRSRVPMAGTGPRRLTAVPVGDALLITTPAEAPGRAEAGRWTERIREALTTGSDATDRLQSVPRWLGEPAPPSGSSADVETRFQAFAAAGWPAAGAAVALADPRARASWSWVVGLGVLALGAAARRVRPGRRAGGLALVASLALMARVWGGSSLAVAASGGVAGALATLAYWLGMDLHLRVPSPRGMGRVSSARQARPRRSEIILPILLVVAAAGIAGAEGIGPEPPILALFPFEGLPELNAPGDRVVLLLQDYQRLDAMAHAEPPRPSPSLFATAASHHIQAADNHAVQIESRYELWLDGEGPTTWPVPIGGARDLSATLDDQAAPLLVEPGGQIARISLAGAGTHQLRVVRTLDRDWDDPHAPVQLPVNPVPAARIAVASRAEVEVSSARGRIERRGDWCTGLLGPAPEIVLRWPPGPAAGPRATKGSVEGVLLWDAQASGDRVQARLTYHHPEGTGQVRLALEPGVIVRSATAPGAIEPSLHGTADRPEWVARIEPPLPDGAAITIDLWRPSDVPEGDVGPRERRAPRVEPLDVGTYHGLLGFRRPGDWSGLLATIPGTEPVADAVFLKAWGSPPDDVLELSGATRFLRAPDLALSTGPIRPRRSVRQSLNVAIEAGRLLVTDEVELTEILGHSFEAELRIPPKLVLSRVEAEGLTYWDRPEPARLRLRFDGPTVERRTIRLQGWLAAPGDPLALTGRRRSSPIPWPLWLDAEEEPGTLTLSAPSLAPPGRRPGPFDPWPFAVTMGPGVILLNREPDPAANASSGRVQLSYQVRRPEELGTLHWTPEPPRVSASVASQLTLLPESAAWVARVGYRVSGGAIDTLFLKLPRVWAASAKIEIVGLAATLEAKPQGDATLWTLHPERPIWGTGEVVVRSSRPLVRGQALDFPNLTPLGWGTAETSLAIVDASGLDLAYESSPGLEPVDVSRFPLANPDASPRTPARAYRIRREGWTLRVRALGAAEGSSPPDDGQAARVAAAELACVLAADGSTQGRASFVIEPHSGPFLPILLRERSDALLGVVEGQPVAPLRGKDGHWLIPLGDENIKYVDIIWRSEPGPAGPDGSRAVPLPGLLQAGVPTLVEVSAPADVKLNELGGLMEPISPAWRAVERAEGHERSIVEWLARRDRGSARDRRAGIAELVRFELLARAAERATLFEPERFSSDMQRLRDRISALRAQLAEAIHAAGLEGWLQDARRVVGLEGAGSARESVVDLEPPTAGRIHRLGPIHAYRFTSPGQGRGPLLHWLPQPTVATWQRVSTWAWTATALGFALVLFGALGRTVRAQPGRLALAWLALAAVGRGLGLIEPIGLAASAVALGIGRFVRA
jgi:hypothetical protein